ncbi:UV-stimulated scaffold protein A [Entomortierella parvispora]|uniref:UV-stimulated scaffold protein A n=1 Tax=Entomortierella parvispora TaxID=205924 RepID=A0A9P3HA34_9FUNG|nr:UV-stimulated scaffold protein A [Entomortierella parvispora]
MAMNLEARETLSNLILAITKTGDLYLDPEQVKQVKAICKKSDVNVKTAYDLLLIQLQRKHAQIRYSSTQLIAELFQRSHVFRELLVADFSVFLQLTVGIHQNTLPPPILFAEKTKQLAISLTNEWNGKYGAVYKQIALGYEFLRYHLKVDFTNLVPVTEEARSAEQRAQEELSKRIRQRKFEKAAAELEDQSDAIQENLKRMDSCFDILVPKLDDDATLQSIFQTSSESVDGDDDDDDGDGGDEQDGQDDGGVELDDIENENEMNEALIRHDPMGIYDNALGSSRYKLTIEVNKDNPVDVHESEDNSELFATLRECYRLIVKKHWPLVMDWLDAFMKADADSGVQRAEYDRLLKLAINLKKDVADAKSKCEDLGVNMDTMYGPHEQDSDEDDADFEEVQIQEKASDKKKGKLPKYKAPISEPKKPKNAVFAMHGAEVLPDDPTYVGGTRITPARAVAISSPSPQSEQASSSRAASEVSTPPAEGEESREVLLARAPVIPWDDDLAVWDKKEMAFNTSGLEFSHRFLGVGDGSNLVSQATLDRMKMRTTIYTPELPAVIKACRYPMSNGRLCMRRDLVRCPYHGPVVPRDEYGQIQRPEDEGGFVPEEKDMLNDEQEAELIQRAIAAASSSPSSRAPKDKSTWEDIEDDVHLALGLEKIEPKRKRGAGGSSSKKKTKPPSALVNINKKPDSSRVRLLRHMASRATRGSVEEDQRIAKSEQSRDTNIHRWTK